MWEWWELQKWFNEFKEFKNDSLLKSLKMIRWVQYFGAGEANPLSDGRLDRAIGILRYRSRITICFAFGKFRISAINCPCLICEILQLF